MAERRRLAAHRTRRARDRARGRHPHRPPDGAREASGPPPALREVVDEPSGGPAPPVALDLLCQLAVEGALPLRGRLPRVAGVVGAGRRPAA